MFSDFAKDAPVSSLIEWLDFAHGEEKGYERFDDLRAMTTGWYTGINNKEFGRALSNMKQRFSRKTDAELEWHLKKVFPSLQKLIARSSVLDGYVGKYQYLEEHHILPSTFENETANISPEFHIDGYIILEPSLN